MSRLSDKLTNELNGINFYSFDDVKLETVFEKLRINRLENSPLGGYCFCDACGAALNIPLTKSVKEALANELSGEERDWAVNALSHVNVYSCGKNCGKRYYHIKKGNGKVK